MVSLDFFFRHDPSGRTMVLGSKQPLSEMHTTQSKFQILLESHYCHKYFNLMGQTGSSYIIYTRFDEIVPYWFISIFHFSITRNSTLMGQTGSFNIFFTWFVELVSYWFNFIPHFSLTRNNILMGQTGSSCIFYTRFAELVSYWFMSSLHLRVSLNRNGT